MPKGLPFATPNKLPLGLILVVPFVVQIFVAVGLISWLSFRNGQRAVNELARELHSEISARIQQDLSHRLSVASLATRINADAIASGYLDISDQQATADYLLTQLNQFSELSGVTVATEDPNYVGIVRGADIELLLSQWDTENGGVIDYQLDDQGKILDIVAVGADYDHRQREWYRSAVDAQEAIWQAPYLTLNLYQLVISIDRPIYDAQGNLLGVADAELMLTDISNFLRQIDLAQSGQILVIERNGKVVATSLQEPPFRINPTTRQPERINLQEKSDPLTSEIALTLTDTFGSLERIDQPEHLVFEANNQRQYVQIAPFHNDPNLDWLVVITVPESEFMDTIHQNTRMTVLLCFGALLVTTGLGVITARWIVRPITNMTEAADALSRGEWQQIVGESPINDLSRLTRAFNRMANQLHTSFSTLAYNAQHDNLTGLLNRGALRTQLEKAIANRYQQQFALFFLDLDDFKLINDSFGHIVGDQLLIAIATRLKETLNNVTKSLDHITFARFGGDEFVILVESISNATEAMQTANQFTQTFAAPFHLQKHEIYASTSIGIALSTLQGERPEDYLRNADIALYAAKKTGKASYEIFDTQMHTMAVDRLALETDLRKAIRQQALEVYYQPIINTQSLHIEGFEALLRWHHRSRGIISPATFIPIAEQSGLIFELGWWVMRQACHQLKTWQQQFPHCNNMVMSINLSSKQFAQPEFTDIVETILSETGLSAQNVKLEITESIFMNSSDATHTKFKWLQDNQIHLSIDDFGTGYSSLSYLYRFPLQTLKIDRSFIHRLTAYYSSKTIVEAIIILGHKLGLNLIAEGVETIEELDWLRQQGCESVQGFLLSCPLTAKAMTTLLANGPLCGSHLTLPPASASEALPNTMQAD